MDSFRGKYGTSPMFTDLRSYTRPQRERRPEPIRVREPDLEPVGEPDLEPGGEPDLEPGGEPVSDERDNRIAELSTRITELEDLVRAHEIRATDAEADVQRAAERIRREARRDVEHRARNIIAGLLEVMDDLDRAIAAARETDASSTLLEGVTLVRKRFLAKLSDHDVSPTRAHGMTFDPNRHEAISTVPVDDPDQVGRVVVVLREGYLIGDETLRPAQVAVGALRS